MSKPIEAFTVRLPVDVAERVDRYADELRKQHPGASVGRGGAILELVLRALDGGEANR